MAVEGISAEGMNQELACENEWKEFSDWNFRIVEYPMISTKTQQLITQYQLIRSQMQCCSGSAEVHVNVDTEGTTEVEASVAVENEDKNITYEVSGSVTHGSNGNTSGKVEGGVKVKW